MSRPILVLRPEFQAPPKTAPQPRTETGGTDAPKGGTPSTTADGKTQGKGAPPAMCGTDQFIMIGAMILIFYFLLIRPQQKQEKQRQALLAATKKGDKVVMNSGLHGTITNLNEKTVTIRVDGEGKIKLTFDRSAIGRLASDDAEADNKK